jgi:hypothetical protein
MKHSGSNWKTHSQFYSFYEIDLRERSTVDYIKGIKGTEDTLTKVNLAGHLRNKERSLTFLPRQKILKITHVDKKERERERESFRELNRENDRARLLAGIVYFPSTKKGMQRPLRFLTPLCNYNNRGSKDV